MQAGCFRIGLFVVTYADVGEGDLSGGDDLVVELAVFLAAGFLVRGREADAYVVLAEQFERQRYVDVLVAGALPVEGVVPVHDVGDLEFGDRVPVVAVVVAVLRPVDPDVAGASDAAVLHGYLHREHIGRDALRREVEQPCFAAVGFGVPPLAFVGPGREIIA